MLSIFVASLLAVAPNQIPEEFDDEILDEQEVVLIEDDVVETDYLDEVTED